MPRARLGATRTTHRLLTKVTIKDISRSISHTEDNRSTRARTIDHVHDHVHANAVTAATEEDNIITITIVTPIVDHSLRAVINLTTITTIATDTATIIITDTTVITIADTVTTTIATPITTDTSPITITLTVPTIDAPPAETATPAIALVIAIAIVVPIAMSAPRTSRSTTATTVVVRRAQAADQRMISPLARAKLDSH